MQQSARKFAGASKRNEKTRHPASGTVHNFAPKSISDQCAPSTSPVLAAIKIANSSARAATPRTNAMRTCELGSSTGRKPVNIEDAG